MKVIVIGGAGYMGSVLVPALLQAGHEVRLLDRFYFGGDTVRSHERLEAKKVDIRRLEGIDFEGFDAAILLAGFSNDPSAQFRPALAKAVNLDATVRAARLALQSGIKRLVFSSSCSVYGHGESTGLTEESPIHPVSLYARLKAEAEEALFELARGTSMAVTCLRFATLFGVSPRMRFDLAVNLMTRDAYLHHRIRVEGGGKQWRPLVHVADAVKAILLVLDAPPSIVAGRRFNVGANENNVRVLNLAYRIHDLVPGTEVDIISVTDPDERNYNVCFDRIERELGFRATKSIEDGAKEIIAALRSGIIDPDDPRCYTVQYYRFLDQVEHLHRELSIDGSILD